MIPITRPWQVPPEILEFLRKTFEKGDSDQGPTMHHAIHIIDPDRTDDDHHEQSAPDADQAAIEEGPEMREQSQAQGNIKQTQQRINDIFQVQLAGERISPIRARIKKPARLPDSVESP